MIYGYFTLFVALVISGVAEYYSIVGLTAIFSASFWPIVIMGASLGVGKLTAAVWLKLNWKRTPWTYKVYLIPAVSFLMMLTSIGCFGYLSKAHSDQGLISGDATAQVALYDEKIRTARDNIDANRKALAQMDEAVDQIMGRSSSETGADKAVSIRRGQQKERSRLQSEIAAEQKTIGKLSQERAPLAAEVRKVEAEVGPIKYIAALIYGDGASESVLEKAVRLVIVLIVLVFDPLALCLILAANKQFEWAREDRQKLAAATEPEPASLSPAPDSDLITTTADAKADDPGPAKVEYRVCPQCGTRIANSMNIGPYCPNPQCGSETAAGANSTVTQLPQLTPVPTEMTQLSPEELDALSNITVPEFDQVGETWDAMMAAEISNAGVADTNPEDNVPIDQEFEPQASVVYEETQQPGDNQMEPCYKCGTPLIHAPGIGAFCPNKACDVLDGPFLEQDETPTIQINLDFDQPDEQPADEESFAEWTDSEFEQLMEDMFASIEEPIDNIETADAAGSAEPIAENEPVVPDAEDDGDTEIINLTDDEMIKSAMRAWKAANPNDTLKHQRQLLAQGRIDQLPWMPMSELQLEADNKEPQVGIMRGFGAQFPVDANKGDSFMRVDQLPGRLYKHNGVRWIEVNRDLSDQYVFDTAYIDHLIAKIGSGEYDIELLTDLEREQIGRRLLNE